MITVKLVSQSVHQVQLLGTTEDLTVLSKALGCLDTYNLNRMHLSRTQIESIQGLYTALDNILKVV